MTFSYAFGNLDMKQPKNPENPLDNGVSSSTFLLSIFATSFWQTPLAANNIEFSAIFAINAGDVPAYRPRASPSLAQVSLKNKK